MKKLLVLYIGLLSHFVIMSQWKIGYDPSVQPTTSMQYFKPAGNGLFVGDCIPFFHEGTWYLYWLIDSGHHSALGGLGGHQWVVSTTKDLKTWKHYPVVLGIDEDWEKSICTGSVVYANKKFYAFYATRLIHDGKVNEQLSYAISEDGIHFVKQQPNPFYTSAPGYSKRDFRDPKVFVDEAAVFHLLVASKMDSAALQAYSGALVHLTSLGFADWQVQKPVLTGQPSVPECPDYFFWNGWYYLVYGDNGNTFYVQSKNRYGPWQQPASQALNEDWVNVVKTAEFNDNRRIAAGWIPSRMDNKDDGREIFGGNVVLREVTQTISGELQTKFPAEVLQPYSKPFSAALLYDSFTARTNDANFSIHAPDGTGAVHFENLPANYRISADVDPQTAFEEYGLIFKAADRSTPGYRLNLSAVDSKVSLGNTAITGVSGLNKKVHLDIVVTGDIIDVCIDNRRCIINRVIEKKGGTLWLYAKHGTVAFKSLKILL